MQSQVVQISDAIKRIQECQNAMALAGDFVGAGALQFAMVVIRGLATDKQALQAELEGLRNPPVPAELEEPTLQAVP